MGTKRGDVEGKAVDRIGDSKPEAGVDKRRGRLGIGGRMAQGPACTRPKPKSRVPEVQMWRGRRMPSR